MHFDVPVKTGRFCDGVNDCLASNYGREIDNHSEDECSPFCNRETNKDPIKCNSNEFFPSTRIFIEPPEQHYFHTCVLSEVFLWGALSYFHFCDTLNEPQNIKRTKKYTYADFRFFVGFGCF